MPSSIERLNNLDLSNITALPKQKEVGWSVQKLEAPKQQPEVTVEPPLIVPAQIEDALIRAIESYVLTRGEQTCANGWSYTQNLTERLGKWSPPPKRKATPTRKP